MKDFAITPDLSEILTEMVNVPFHVGDYGVEYESFYTSFIVNQGCDPFILYDTYVVPSLMCLANMVNKECGEGKVLLVPRAHNQPPNGAYREIWYGAGSKNGKPSSIPILVSIDTIQPDEEGGVVRNVYDLTLKFHVAS